MKIGTGIFVILICGGLSSAASIDTRQYGLLRIGMSQTAVVARVGEPDAVTSLGSVHTVNRSMHGRGLVVREQVREAWDYVGGRSLPTRLIFANGVLVKKEKR